MRKTINKYTYSCKECGNEFQDWKSSKRIFCSMKCRNNNDKGKPTWNKGLRGWTIATGAGFQKGEANPMWCGGDSDSERRNSDYIHWRISVFKRDGFTCQECGYRNGNGTKRKDLNAHHIVKWIDSIELRYEVDNGKTLCVPCHINEHTPKD